MLHVIWNPNAGKGKAHKVVGILRQHFPNAQFWESITKNSIKSLLNKISSLEPTALMVVGGDGTINSLAYHTELIACPVIPVPVGSGNGIAHQLGINSVKDSIRALKNQQVCKWHIIETNKSIKGLNILGIGITGFVAHRFTLTKRGLYGYIKSVLKAINLPEDMYIINGEEKRAWDISFVRGGEWGNSVSIHPDANGCNTYSAIVILRKPALWNFLFHFSLLLMKNHDKSALWHCFETDQVVIDRGSRYGHIDGEPIEITYPFKVWTSNKYILFKRI